MPVLAKVGFGVGVAGAVLGLYAGFTALGRKNQLASECNAARQCDASNDGASDLDAAHTWATVSTVSFIVAGAGAVTGLAALLVAPSHEPAPAAASVRPWVGPGMAGVHGRF